MDNHKRSEHLRRYAWVRSASAVLIATLLVLAAASVYPGACIAAHGQGITLSKAEVQAAASAARLRALQRLRSTPASTSAKPIAAKSGLLSPRHPMDPSPYGVTGVSWEPYVIGRMNEMGVRWARIMVSWDRHEPVENQFDWNPDYWGGTGKLDTWIPALAAQGFSISVLIQTPPAWSLDRPGGIPVPSKMAGFCRALAQHFGAQINCIEILTEENCQCDDMPSRQADRFVPVLKECYQAIKSVNPNILVAMSGVPGPHGDPDYMTYMGELYRAGAKSYFDVANIHFYPGNNQRGDPIPDLTVALAHIRWVMGRYGDTGKRLWITEIGYAVPWTSQNNGQYTEAEQATYLVNTMDVCRRSGIVERVFWYQLRNDDGMALICSPCSVPDGTYDTVRPAFYAYKNYITKWPRWNTKDTAKAWQTDRAEAVSIQNAGFENGTTGWWGNVVLDSTVAHSGTASGKIVISGKEGGASQEVILTAHASAYMLTGYMKGDGNVGARMALTYTNAQHENLLHYNGNTIFDSTAGEPDGWHQFQIAVPVPPGATRAYVYIWALTGSGAVWYDDIELVPYGEAAPAQTHGLD